LRIGEVGSMDFHAAGRVNANAPTLNFAESSANAIVAKRARKSEARVFMGRVQ
jgi:hypothetical protein